MPRNRRPTPAPGLDWEPHKEYIIELYWRQDKGLKEVMAALKQDREFEATERQYKRKFKDWFLEKNISEEDMRALLCIRAWRRRRGKETHFTRYGIDVPPERLNRFARRKHIDEGSLPDQEVLAPPGVRCTTPIRALPTDSHRTTPPSDDRDTSSPDLPRSPERLGGSPSSPDESPASTPSLETSPNNWEVADPGALLSPSSLTFEPQFDPSATQPFQSVVPSFDHAGLTSPYGPFFGGGFAGTQLNPGVAYDNHASGNAVSHAAATTHTCTQACWNFGCRHLRFGKEMPRSRNAVERGYYSDNLSAGGAGAILPDYGYMGCGPNTSISSERGLNRETQLHAAVLNENIAEVRALLEAGADPNLASGGITPLHYAAFRRNVELVRLLKYAGARLDSTTEKTRSMLFFAVCSQDRLLRGGRLPHANPGWQVAHPDKHTDEETKQVINALYGYDDLDVPLQLKVSLKQADVAGVTPLMAAAEQGFKKTVRLFLNYRACPEAEDDQGYTALKYAANKAHGDVVELLLREDPRVKKREVKHMVQLAERNLRLTPGNSYEWWDITRNYDVDIIGEAMIRIYQEKGVLEEVIALAREKRLHYVVKILDSPKQS